MQQTRFDYLVNYDLQKCLVKFRKFIFGAYPTIWNPCWWHSLESPEVSLHIFLSKKSWQIRWKRFQSSKCWPKGTVGKNAEVFTRFARFYDYMKRRLITKFGQILNSGIIFTKKLVKVSTNEEECSKPSSIISSFTTLRIFLLNSTNSFSEFFLPYPTI